MRPVALARRRRRRAGERREDVGELGARVVVEHVEPARLEPVDVVVERVDEDRERQLALELGGAAGEHEAARVGAARPSSASIRVLPMPGSPTSWSARAPPLERGEGSFESLQLGGTPDDLLGCGAMPRQARA